MGEETVEWEKEWEEEGAEEEEMREEMGEETEEWGMEEKGLPWCTSV